MFFAKEPQKSGIYISKRIQGLFKPSYQLIRTRKIALYGEDAVCCINEPVELLRL